MPASPPDLAPLVNRIPRLYFLLRAAVDALHADLEITAGMRGVMTTLSNEAWTVPDMARARPVSRQHIQMLVNDLLAAGLVETRPNPQHRRSALIGLTGEGRRRLQVMRERETQLLERTAPQVSPAELLAATRLFDRLEQGLAARVAEQEPH